MTQHEPEHITPQAHPLGKAIIYTRSVRGVHTQTTQEQQNALLAFAHEQGYNHEQITLIDEQTVCGREAPAPHTACNALRTAITKLESAEEPLTAIYIVTEDRLFRDATSIDIARFIETCSQQGVLVITPAMTYDFTKPDHAALFRSIGETASPSGTQEKTSRGQEDN